MNSMMRFLVLASLSLLPGLVSGEDRVSWVADFSTACGMAAEQKRLVLLHFYNDNCGPCVRVEQNVFSRPEVAEAVAQNFLAVKVHAGKNPQLATKYHVNQWPTDVFVTASGLEVYRTVSPQKPADYVAILNQVATQSGVGASRVANNPLQTIAQAGSKTQAALGAAASGLAGLFTASDQRVQQTSAQAQGSLNDTQRAANEAQQKWNAATLPAQNAVNQSRATAQNVMNQATTAAAQSEQQIAAAAQKSAANASTAVQQAEQKATDVIQQTTNTAKQWETQAAATAQRYESTAKQYESTAQQYEQQASTAYQQARDRATQMGQQIEQQADAAKQQVQTSASQAAAEVTTAAQDLKQQAASLGASLLDRRSAFVPVETSPAAATTTPVPSAASTPVPSAASTPVPSAASTPAPSAASTPAPSAASTPAPSAASIPAATPPAPSATIAAAAPSPPATAPSPQPEQVTVAAAVPQAVTNNPWIASKPEETRPTSVATAEPPASALPSARVYSSAAGAASASAAAVQASAMLPTQAPQPPPNNPVATNHQMVPVSQAPPLGLDGFCPVTLVETMANNPGDRGAWKKGDRRFGAIHKGRTYLFTSAQQQQKFLQNPDLYAPVLSGCDPVFYAERGQMVDGKRAFGLVTSDRHIYLFADEASRNRFEKSPASYTTALQQAAAKNQSASVYR